MKYLKLFEEFSINNEFDKSEYLAELKKGKEFLVNRDGRDIVVDKNGNYLRATTKDDLNDYMNDYKAYSYNDTKKNKEGEKYKKKYIPGFDVSKSLLPTDAGGSQEITIIQQKAKEAQAKPWPSQFCCVSKKPNSEKIIILPKGKDLFEWEGDWGYIFGDTVYTMDGMKGKLDSGYLITIHENNKKAKIDYGIASNYMPIKLENITNPQKYRCSDPEFLPYQCCPKDADYLVKYNVPVSKGCQGKFVKEIQERLGSASDVYAKMLIGNNQNATDSKFGRSSSEAIKQFQKDNSLTVTGKVDKKTWEKLSKIEPTKTYDVAKKSWVNKGSDQMASKGN
jgi:peptidoglycan hydrolase-like protein with peptidoglycan-binding domain